MIDATVRRCAQSWCNRIARWRDRDEVYWCKDHAPTPSEYVMPELPPPPPEMEGELIGSASLRMRVRRK